VNITQHYITEMLLKIRTTSALDLQQHINSKKSRF